MTLQNVVSERVTIATPVQFQSPLPESVDVVVIGGGVVGVFTALYLSRLQHRVLLCEKGRIAGEQSSRNWGWIRQQGRDPDELPIMMEAIRLWREVDELTRGGCGFNVQGTHYIAATTDQDEENQAWLELASQHGLDSRMMTRQELDDITGGFGSYRWLSGLVTPSDARGEPWQAVPAVATLATSEGALIRENCAVRSIDVAGGNVSGVYTEDGRVGCDKVVLAGGAWSSLLARLNDINLPQLAVRSSVAQTAPMSEFAIGNYCDEALAFRRRADGGFTLAMTESSDHFVGPDSVRHFGKFLPLLRSRWKTINLRPAAPGTFPDAWLTPRKWQPDEVSPFEQQRVLEPVPNRHTVERMKSCFAERFEKIGEPKILKTWAGMIDTMPDIVPVIDQLSRPRGLTLATGLSGHGFGIGPGIGRVVADLVAGNAPGYDLSRFRLSRFSDGSDIALGPSL